MDPIKSTVRVQNGSPRDCVLDCPRHRAASRMTRSPFNATVTTCNARFLGPGNDLEIGSGCINSKPILKNFLSWGGQHVPLFPLSQKWLEENDNSPSGGNFRAKALKSCMSCAFPWGIKEMTKKFKSQVEFPCPNISFTRKVYIHVECQCPFA